VDERVGAAMHQVPIRAVAAMDWDAQRPVVVGQPADLPVLKRPGVTRSLRGRTVRAASPRPNAGVRTTATSRAYRVP
jgi:hypothetical protein